jgi:type IV pilus assembly protein PilV
MEMPMKGRRRITNRPGGFTLLEVLVALLVLSIGVLGIAGLQATSLRNKNNAYLRTQANILAYDIVDRMRANRSAALSSSYDISLGNSPSGSTTAATDLAEWKSNLADSLTNGDGAVSCTSAGLCSVTVQWDEVATDGTDRQFVLSTEI